MPTPVSPPSLPCCQRAGRRNSPPRRVLAQATATPGATPAPFILPALPYATNAFEPTIDARTMEIHHGKHHSTYVANLNTFAKDTPAIAQKPIVEVLADLKSVPDAIRTGVRNNLGGHANHSMFWQIMGPNGGKPDRRGAGRHHQ